MNHNPSEYGGIDQEVRECLAGKPSDPRLKLIEFSICYPIGDSPDAPAHPSPYISALSAPPRGPGFLLQVFFLHMETMQHAVEHRRQ